MQKACGDRRLALLLVCKQIYAEAIDLFYSHPTFVISDFVVFFAFVQSVLPHRLASIRKLHLHFVLRWPEITSWWHQKSGKPDNAFLWSRVWDAIAERMTGLKVLGLYIRQFTWNQKALNAAINASTERRVLLPLVKLRDLKEFNLWYRHERVKDPFGGDFGPLVTHEMSGEECQDQAAQAFRRWLSSAVKMPRGSLTWFEEIDDCHIADAMG